MMLKKEMGFLIIFEVMSEPLQPFLLILLVGDVERKLDVPKEDRTDKDGIGEERSDSAGNMLPGSGGCRWSLYVMSRIGRVLKQLQSI
jgi:hypothetical protein